MREPDSLFGGLATINEDSESGTMTNSPTGPSRACAAACEQGGQEEERGSPLHTPRICTSQTIKKTDDAGNKSSMFRRRQPIDLAGAHLRNRSIRQRTRPPIAQRVSGVQRS